jgi:hypothetical protein
LSELDDELNADPFDDESFGTVVPKEINISRHLDSSESARLQNLCRIWHKLAVEILERDAEARIFSSVHALGHSRFFPDAWVSLTLHDWLGVTDLFEWQFHEGVDALKEKRLIADQKSEGSERITLRADKEAFDRMQDQLYPES